MAERWDERDRGYRRDQNERDLSDRAGDEVRSWFGDDEAAQRRRMDEAREGRQERDWGNRASAAGERAWERTRDTVRDMTDRDRDGRRGFAEWNDNDRPWDRSRTAASSGTINRGREDYWTRDRNYNTPSYGNYNNPTYGTPDYSSDSRWNPPSAAPYGQYAGRGPRGYRRGDERIREDVCDRLTDDARIDASDIDVQVKDGEVTLNGSVRSRDEKRFTEDLIERISGVRDVSNHLKVKAADEVIGTARSGASVLGLTDAPPPPPAKTK